MQYATIVADPPWPYGKFNNGPSTTGAGFRGKAPQPLPYPTMTVEQIAALPVAELADPAGCNLFLWTTSRYLHDAFHVATAWGFRYSQTLVWTKAPSGLGLGGAFAPTTEFVLFCRRGKVPIGRRVNTTWFNWKRTLEHSRKPEHFIDLVEQMSPAPRLEMFSRRHRLGWHVWGDQVESSIEVPA